MSAGDSILLTWLLQLQDSAASVWVRESSWGLFFFLILHTLSMGFLAGTGMALCARVLGISPGVPLARMARLQALMAPFAIVAILSGIVLVVGYPAKALTNVVFYVKLVLALLGWRLNRRLARVIGDREALLAPLVPRAASAVRGTSAAHAGSPTHAPPPSRSTSMLRGLAPVATACIAAWVLAIATGRFLAYTALVTLLPTMTVHDLLVIGNATGVRTFMTEGRGWAIAEALHFIGLAVLLGTVGLFDLCVLGIVRGVPLSALRRLLPFGFAAWACNLCTGTMFLVSMPDQYLHNPAFNLKLCFMALAAVNLVLYLLLAARGLAAGTHDASASRWVRVSAAVSLGAWIAVIICGRLITLYRPPAYWCPWCS